MSKPLSVVIDELIKERNELKTQLTEVLEAAEQLARSYEKVTGRTSTPLLNKLRAVMKKGTYGAALSSKATSPKREGRGAKKHGPYCHHTVVIDGSEVGCALVYGHSGEHDHIRGLGVSTKRVDAQATLSSTLRNE